MAERFYTPEPLAPGEFVLAGAEAHHLATVRRFSVGDRVTLFNGDGNEYPAEVIGLSKKSASLNVLAVEPADRELGFPLVAASAVPKADRADFLVEKLTELGVTRFVPLVTARSVVVPKETNVEKFRRNVIEASKQCGRNRLMVVDPPQRWNELLARQDLPDTRLVLHTAPGTAELTRRAGGVVVAIGPEGGFTPEEVDAALAAGWAAVGLGSRVLRVETAAVAAAAVLALGSR